MSKSTALAIGLVVLFVAGIAGYFVANSTRESSIPVVEARDDVAKVEFSLPDIDGTVRNLSLIHISEPTRLDLASRMPSSA